MGTKKKLVLPEKIPFLETDYDLDVTIEIVESDSYDARLDEFVKLGCFVSTFWVGRKPISNKCPLNWKAYDLAYTTAVGFLTRFEK